MSDADRAAVLLVGGASRRMESPKADLLFGKQTLLERSVHVLQQVVPTVVVVSAPGQTLSRLPDGVLLVSDDRRGQGPLEGLRAGLTVAAESAAAACVTAVDAPFLKPAFLERLFALLAGYDAVVPEQAGRLHPLSGCYRTSVATTARELLARGERSVQALLDRLDTRVADAGEFRDSDPELRSLENVNTPEEYRLALARFEREA